MPKQPKGEASDVTVEVNCRGCGHTLIADMPELYQRLITEFQNELGWQRQRIQELEEEILVLTQFDDCSVSTLGQKP